MLFGNKKLDDIHITINSEKLSRAFQTKFLGVIIQHNLKWNEHINIISNKISKTLGVLNKIKHCLATSHLRLLYQTLVEPYLRYCCIIWGNPKKTGALDSLYKLQKRAVRIILFQSYRAHSKPLFVKLNLPNVYDLCLAQILIYAYKSVNNLLPSTCTSYFTHAKDTHQHATRGHEFNLYVINAKKSCRVNSLSFRGPKYWNSLPNNIRLSSSLNVFKTLLREYLISNYSSS